MKYQVLPLPSLLVVALSAAFAPQAFAAAGTAQFTAGDVQVKRADGGFSPLSKGKAIDSGQSVVTGTDGRAQVRFTDGGLISLQPNTEFKIASYVDKLDAKEDRFLVDLLRGSMRAITGLIGKRNRDNYKVNTATATIGIRGSGFNVGYNPDGTLSVTTELDAIEVCTAAGCVGLTAGESVKVLSNSQAPVRTNVRAPVPTPTLAQEALTVTQQAGALAQVVAAKPVPIPAPEPGSVNFVATDIAVQTVGVSPFAGQLPTNPVNFGQVVTTTFNPAGQLLDVKNLQTSEIFTSSAPGADRFSSGAPSDPDFIAWGSWTNSSRFNSVTQAETPYERFSYVAGRPTLSTDVPTTGTVGYASLGGSIPVNTPISAGVITTGVFNSASMNIDFSVGTVGVSINTSIGAMTAGTGVLAPGTVTTFTGSDGNSSTFTGFLIGPGGARAGMSYNLLFGSGRTTGTIAFQANF